MKGEEVDDITNDAVVQCVERRKAHRILLLDRLCETIGELGSRMRVRATGKVDENSLWPCV